MSNFLNNTIDLQKIYNEVKDLDVLIDELQSKFIISGPTIITFTINNFGEYQAEEGMTWTEWCESEYSDDMWYAGDARVSNVDDHIATIEGTKVSPNDIIIANYNYITVFESWI